MGPGFESQPGHKQNNSVSLFNDVTVFFCLRGEIGRHAILRGWFPMDVLVRVQSQAQQRINNEWYLGVSLLLSYIAYLKKTDSVAQLVEQYTFNVWVLGSNPSRVTKLLLRK